MQERDRNNDDAVSSSQKRKALNKSAKELEFFFAPQKNLAIKDFSREILNCQIGLRFLGKLPAWWFDVSIP